jgi:hypothetical protein
MLSPKRFTFPHTDGKYRSYRDFIPEDDGDIHPTVTVTSTSPGRHTIEVDSYYSPFGVLKLEITQPLDRALKMFGVLLCADSKAEAETGN